ncbi:MAG: DUF3108 domain-containing protein [Alphaproteobacteria bacterium]|jgi:hypothetical protein|nr:DUF3108 domain-containing protein [Alphaproteobacteria bacterium]
MLKRLFLATSLSVVPFAAQAVDAPAPPTEPVVQGSGPASTVQLVWQVYLGGFNLGNIGIKSSFAGNSYSAVSRLKTAGVVNSFYEAIIDATTVGAVGGNGLVPQKYDSNTNNEKTNQKVGLTYSSAGIQLFSDPPYNTERFPVTEEQKRGTLDPLSGLVFALSGISQSAAKPCGETVRVFDGRRRYDIELNYVGQDKVKTDGGYSGPAVKCTVIYKQLAGFKPNLNKGKSIPVITTWLAPMESSAGGPVKKFMVPVKIMTDTPYGVALAHARKVTVDGVQKSE